MAEFKEGVELVSDLKVGMQLEGVVSNVAAFGAFVDIGVHQDGLVHVSELSNHFVKDPREVVRVGQIVKVRVLEVDVSRNRISLSMKSNSGARTGASKPKAQRPMKDTRPTLGAMANAFSKLKR